MTKKSLLVILDGWGLGSVPEANAIAHAKTPYFDELMTHYPHATLTTHGEAVGLPEGQMGNSEVGHLNIGAGRVVYQELARINKAIRDRTLEKEQVLLDAAAYAKKEKKNIHILGLLSDGGVHSHIEHIKALAQFFHKTDGPSVFIHAFLDGRDTDPESGAGFITDLLGSIRGTKASLATIIGRYYAMDRDERWERIKKAYDLLIHGVGKYTDHPIEAVKDSYNNQITDEFIDPIICNNEGTIQPGDVVFFANFRTDRPRQLVRVLSQEVVKAYDMSPIPVYMVTMTNYDDAFKNIHVVFTKDTLRETIGEVIATNDLTQLRIAETEKYPHVTFFFSGGQESAFPGETRILIPSPKVATYDLQPSMSARELTLRLIPVLKDQSPDFVCLNFANADMVGHTGVFSAVIEACETVDACLKELIPVALSKHYEIIIIADHGNADYMINEDSSPNTAHSTNPVPILYVSHGRPSGIRINTGILADVAPTLLDLMGIIKPDLMTGKSLIQKVN